jgi:tRNA-specific 2-thiouridylase
MVPDAADTVAFRGPADKPADRARRVADHLGIPLVVYSATEVFEHDVLEHFVQAYAQGRTPNPCVRCNAHVKFPMLLACARRLGLECVATGHYARLVGHPRRLARGVDPAKDQSYVLAQVPPGLLTSAIFPLGTMSKKDVRRIAHGASLHGHVSSESQDICFLAGNDHKAFLAGQLGEQPGIVVDTSGKVVGRHFGTYNYTIGQRKGLGIATSEPLYVVALDAPRREVVVGNVSDLQVGALTISDVVIHRPIRRTGLTVQVRSSGAPARARLSGDGVVALEEPVAGVAPGQTAVLYDGDAVVLAGTIVSTRPWAANGGE